MGYVTKPGFTNESELVVHQCRLMVIERGRVCGVIKLVQYS